MCNEGSEKLILSNKNTDKITRNNNYYYYHNLNNTNYSLSKNRKSNYTNYDYLSFRSDDDKASFNNNIKIKIQSYCTMRQNYSMKNYTSNTWNIKQPKNKESEYYSSKNNCYNNDVITMSKKNSLFDYISNTEQNHKPINSN